MKEVLVLERVDGSGTDPSCHWTKKPACKVTEKDIFTVEPKDEKEVPRVTVAKYDAELSQMRGRWEIDCYEVELTMVETKRLAEGLVEQRLEHYLQRILEGAFRKYNGGLCLRIFTEGE